MATKKRKRPSPPVNTECFTQAVRQTPTDTIKMLQRQLEQAEKRTDIESVAGRTAGLVETITETRSHMAELERALASQREHLSKSLLEHALAVAKFRELGAVPQPTT